MKQQPINPWKWQDPYNFTQAWKVEGAGTLLFISGQSSISAEGAVMHPDDFQAQVRLTFENLQTVLEKAGLGFDSVMKLTTYLTDMADLEAYSTIQAEFLNGRKPAQTVVQVSALALPGMRVEVEALAVS